MCHPGAADSPSCRCKSRVGVMRRPGVGGTGFRREIRSNPLPAGRCELRRSAKILNSCHVYIYDINELSRKAKQCYGHRCRQREKVIGLLILCRKLATLEQYISDMGPLLASALACYRSLWLLPDLTEIGNILNEKWEPAPSTTPPPYSNVNSNWKCFSVTYLRKTYSCNSKCDGLSTVATPDS